MTVLDITRLHSDGTDVGTANPLPASDVNSAAGSGCEQLTVGAADVAAGRAIEINCTNPGVAMLKFADGSVLPFDMPAVGQYARNYAIVGIVAAGTTATATYWIIK